MFASNSDRLALVNSVSSFNACRFAVRFSKNGRDSELHFSDGEFESAFDTAHAWKHVHGAAPVGAMDERLLALRTEIEASGPLIETKLDIAPGLRLTNTVNASGFSFP